MKGLVSFLLFIAAGLGFASWFLTARRLTGDAEQDAFVRRTLRRRLTVSWILLAAALLVSVLLR